MMSRCSKTIPFLLQTIHLSSVFRHGRAFTPPWTTSSRQTFGFPNAAATPHQKTSERTVIAQLADNDNDSHPFVGQIGSLAYHRMDVRSDKTLNPQSSESALLKWIEKKNFKDIFLVSHGWNTDATSAWKCYRNLFDKKHMDAIMVENDLKSRDFGIVGITWDSRTREDQSLEENINELIQDFPEDKNALKDVQKKVKALDRIGVDPSQVFDPATSRRPLVRKQQGPSSGVDNKDKDAGEIALDELRSSITKLMIDDKATISFAFEDVTDFSPDEEEEQNDDDDEDVFSAKNLAKRVSQSSNDPAHAVSGNDWPNPLNFHFHMKRAATLGRDPVSPTLQAFEGNQKVRVHLLGHSFGALLVAAAAFEDARPGDHASMTLVQGAFSHSAFAKRVVRGRVPGMFRNVLEEEVVSGPIAVTYTQNDIALAYGYPLAARFLGIKGINVPAFRAAKILGPGRFGAIGRNGAQGQLEKVIKGDMSKYALVNGHVNNLDAGGEIEDHNDVWTEPVARLLVRAAKSSL